MARLLACFTALCCAPATLAAATEDWLNLSIEQLLNVEVYSASRQLETVRRAPAALTVITAQQIRRRGYKTLKDVLDQVPGFLTLPEESTYLLSNRGFTQNPNSNYLILWNNIPLNNQRLEGAEEYILFPDLSMAERIEVIRGPGSTLWGADAAMGIIHIISKTPAQLLDGATAMGQLSHSYDARQQKHSTAFTGAVQMSADWSGQLNLTRASSQARWTDYYQMNAQGLYKSQLFMNPYLSYDPSTDLQLGINDPNWQLRYRELHFEHFDMWGTHNQLVSYPGLSLSSDKDTVLRKYAVSYQAALTGSWHFSSNIAYGSYQVDSTLHDPSLRPDEQNWTAFDYEDASLDLLLHYQWSSHRLKLGAQGVWRDFSRQRETGVLRAGQLSQVARVNHTVGYEQALGIFIEDEYQWSPALSVIAGLRYDRNDFRLPGSELYPRLALVYQPESVWSAKYSYNQGYVRPVLERADGSYPHPLIIGNRMFLGPERPQTAKSHDLQFSYQQQPWQWSLTVYQYQLDDFIARLGYEPGTSLNGYILRYQNQNVGDITGRGLELEWTYEVSANLAVYGNLAVSKATFAALESQLVDGSANFSILTNMHYAAPDRRTTGAPRYLWNLGIDWQISPVYSLNLHYRGFADLVGKISTQPAFRQFGPGHFVDFTLTVEPFYHPALSLQCYGRQLFGGLTEFPTAPHGGLIVEDNRQFGVQLDWRF